MGTDSALKELAEALRDLHRRVAERARRVEASERHVIISPEEFLHLLLSDPRFAWLRALSELIVDLDVFLRAEPAPTDDEAAAIRSEVERMIGAPAYLRYVNEDSRVAVVHRRARRLAQHLPKADSVNEADVLHERHRWAEARRHARR